MNTKFHRSFSFLTALLLALAISWAQAIPVHAAANTTTRLSLDSSGVEGNGYSYGSSISADGRYVAFESAASNLVSGDANATNDVFMRDTLANTTTRVSLNSSGVEGNGWSNDPSISANGRYVAFESSASNLVSGDANATNDVFVRDTLANTTTRVSLDSSGVEGNGDSWHPSISADGRYVAFHSDASNLVSGDTNGMTDIFVRDTLTNTTTRASLDSSGVEGNGWSYNPSISADGRYVAFESSSSNLVSGDANASTDVFVRDTLTNTTTRASLDSSDVEGNGYSFNPSVSADGRYVAFHSSATNLGNGDTNAMDDIFVRDTVANTTTRVSLDSSGVEGNGDSSYATISADGRYVAFQSNATNLVSGDANAVADVFVRDTVANTTTRVSRDSSGVEGDDDSSYPSISAEGRYVAFESDATNLVSGDTNGAKDIFLHESSADTTPPAIVSITRSEPNPTSALAVNFTVAFTEPVTGVDMYDFSLTYSTTGASITYTNCNYTGDTCFVGVSTGTGNGTIQLGVPAGATITDLDGNPLTGLPYTGGEIYTVKKILTLRSVGTYDGWILESSETSGKGGTLDKTAATFFLGDGAQDKQYRAILHFDTSTLPDNAVVTKVTLKIKKQGLSGTNPFTILGGLKVDMRKPYFGANAGLVVGDFQAVAGKSAVATFNATPVSNWYSAFLNTTGRAYVNKTGTTQFRLRFATDDNNDNGADYMKFYSGNTTTISARPTLIIEYYIP